MDAHRRTIRRIWSRARLPRSTSACSHCVPTPRRLRRVPDEAIDERTPIHQLRHPEPARGPAARSRNRCARDADLPDDVVRLPRLRPRRGAVQRRAARARVLADYQPHHRGARGAGRGARRRRGGHRHRERTGRDAPRDRDDCRRRRAHRRLVRALRRLAQPALLHPAPLRHRDDVRRPSGPRRISCRHPPRDPARVQRDPRQSGARRPRRSGGRGGRARRGPAAARRFHVHHALAHAPVRSRRRPRLPFGDEVPRRSRRGNRRGARGRRHLRLGRLGPVSDPERALRRLPRPGVHRGIRPRRVHHARAQGRGAGLRRMHEPHHRVPHPARRGNALVAHGAARLEHPQGGRVPEPATTRSRASSIRSSPIIATTSSRRSCSRAAAGAVFSFELQGGRDAGRTFLESALRVFSSSGERRRCQVTRHPPREHHAPSDGRRGACTRRDLRGDGPALDRT